MKTLKQLSHLLIALPLIILSGKLHAGEGRGTNSGGGVGKPALGMSTENLLAIINSPKVHSKLSLGFGIENINLLNVDDGGYHYDVTGRTFTGNVECKLAVTVWNTHATLTNEVRVTSVNVISGCVFPRPRTSVLETYKDVFKKFKKPVDFNSPYENTLKVVRDLSPEQRKTIKEAMKDSDPQFYKVLSANSQTLSNFMKENPRATTKQMLLVLHKVMGFPTDVEGIFMPPLIALNFAPFFIIEK
jgi:hypothetical protein